MVVEGPFSCVFSGAWKSADPQAGSSPRLLLNCHFHVVHGIEQSVASNGLQPIVSWRAERRFRAAFDWFAINRSGSLRFESYLARSAVQNPLYFQASTTAASTAAWLGNAVICRRNAQRHRFSKLDG